jgi:hypothetical protein
MLNTRLTGWFSSSFFGIHRWVAPLPSFCRTTLFSRLADRGTLINMVFAVKQQNLDQLTDTLVKVSDPTSAAYVSISRQTPSALSQPTTNFWKLSIGRSALILPERAALRDGLNGGCWSERRMRLERAFYKREIEREGGAGGGKLL